MKLTAITDQHEIDKAMMLWRQAFRRNTKSKPNVWQFWSSKHKVTLSAGTHDGKKLYGLLDHCPTAKNEPAIVEINPPSNGNSQGNNQGVVATSEDGSLLLLRRSRMSIPGAKIELSETLRIHGLKSETVRWPDGRNEVCFLVTNLEDDDATIVANTARFMDGCKLARLRATGASLPEIEGAKNATFVEEVMGT